MEIRLKVPYNAGHPNNLKQEYQNLILAVLAAATNGHPEQEFVEMVFTWLHQQI